MCVCIYEKVKHASFLIILISQMHTFTSLARYTKVTFLRTSSNTGFYLCGLILRVWVSQKWFSQQSVIKFEVYLHNTTSVSYLFWSTGNIYTLYFSRDFCAYCGGNWRSLLTLVGVVSRLIPEFKALCCFETLCCYVVFENDPIVLFFFPSGTQGLNITWNLVREWL